MTTANPTPAHLSSKTDNWPTPQDFFDALNAEFGFVLDACASTANHKASAFYALDHTDETRRDGLAGDWAGDAAELGGAVWMNPPYGRPIGAWMAKAHATAQAGAVVVTLVPVRADTAWWHTHVLATGAEVRYVRGRLTFGDAVNTAAFASAVVVYRPNDVPGAPGPVGTMPARPMAATGQGSAAVAARTMPGDADRRTRAPARALDCMNSRPQTTSMFEHLFEQRGWVETADAEVAARPKARTRPTESTMTIQRTPAAAAAGARTVSRLDRLTTQAVAELTRRHVGRVDVGATLEASRLVVARHGGLGRTYRREAAVQHLFATTWTYMRSFAPSTDWALASADTENAQLLWRHPLSPARQLVDVVCASGDLDGGQLPAGSDLVVRLVNLTNPSESFVRLPHADLPVTLSGTGRAELSPVRELVSA